MRCREWKNNRLDHWHGKAEQEVKSAKFNGRLMAARASKQQRASEIIHGLVDGLVPPRIVIGVRTVFAESVNIYITQWEV